MKRMIYSMVLVLFITWISACEKEDSGIPDSSGQVSNNSEEVLPAKYQDLHGLWKPVSISGGFSGVGYEPDFDYLDIGITGMYRIVSNNSVIEFGHIILANSEYKISDALQINFIADYYISNPYFYPGFIVDVDRHKMNLNALCCDFYNYHFKRLPYSFSEFGVTNLSH